jgi:hypothetical protein
VLHRYVFVHLSAPGVAGSEQCEVGGGGGKWGVCDRARVVVLYVTHAAQHDDNAAKFTLGIEMLRRM